MSLGAGGGRSNGTANGAPQDTKLTGSKENIEEADMEAVPMTGYGQQMQPMRQIGLTTNDEMPSPDVQKLRGNKKES